MLIVNVLTLLPTLLLLLLLPATGRGQCPSDKPVLIGGLKCDDPRAGTWYQVEVYRRCQAKKGRIQTVLEVAERTPAGHEIRRSLPHGAVQSFVQDQTLAGNRQPQLFVTKLEGGSVKERQICGEQTRTNLGSVKCETGKTWVGFDVDGMCIKLLGQPVSALSFVEKGPERSKVRKILNQNDARVLAMKNRGQQQTPIWRGTGTKKTALEAIARLRPDGHGFDLVELRVAPEGAERCTRIVEVAALWVTAWPVVPRRGFIEAVGFPSRDMTRIEQVGITVSPVESPPCERLIDVSGIWDVYH